MMFLLRLILTAFASLRAHIMRSLLAMLGVLIGVAAVIVAMSTIHGATEDVLESIGKIGANVLTVFPGAMHQGRRIGTQTLKLEDAEAIEKECPNILAASPEINAPATVKFFSTNISTTVVGTDQQYVAARNYKPVEGRFISREDVLGERRVIVLGYDAAKKLCGEGTPLGYYVRVRGHAFRVVGVMEQKGTVGFTRVDEQVYIPVTTAMKRVFGIRFLTNISIAATAAQNTEEVKDQVKKILRQRHRIPPGDPDDFTVWTQEEILKQFSEISKILGVVSFTIAGVSLLVGGIGIMNIMLVSVTERTREIGVRMAVGAQRWHIMTQFLVEALVICLLGGGAGIALGYLGCDLISQTTPLKTAISGDILLLAVIVSAATGAASGLYPAFKASRLDPVEALRFE